MRCIMNQHLKLICSLLSVIGIVAFFSATMAAIELLEDGGMIFLVLANLVFVAANTVLHVKLCAKGKMPSYILPISWVACLLPNYIYSYHITATGFFGSDFVFGVLLLLLNLPILIVSVLTLIFHFLSKAQQKKKSVQNSES